jgi:hypothetical protein
MGMEKNYEDWAEDAGVLHELAQQLLPQSPKVQVRLHREAADRAVAAWQRDEDPGVSLGSPPNSDPSEKMQGHWP